MLKLSLLGANQAEMVDCSDVIPVPPPLPASAGPHLPPNTTLADVEVAVCPPLRRCCFPHLTDYITRLQCAFTPFPALTALPGPATSISPVPPS